jgi:hypothetical protein
MEPVIVGAGALVAATIVGGTVRLVLAKRRWTRTLKQTARQLGLDFRRRTVFRQAKVVGVLDGVTLRVTSRSARSGRMSKASVEALIELEGLPGGIVLERRGRLGDLHRPLSGAVVPLHIEDFDRRFLLRGPDAGAVLAAFGAEARARVLPAVGERGARLGSGRIELVRPGLDIGAEELAATTTDLLELARALMERASDPADALLSHAFGDPDVGFRRRCLKYLLRQLSRSDQAREAMSVARTDVDPGIRFLALRELGDEATGEIRLLVRHGGLPEDLHAEAVDLLGPKFGGGLSVEVGDGGELSIEPAEVGGLSKSV